MPPRCRTFGDRPTIVAQADCWPAGVSSVRRIRLPIGSSVPKYVVASCWLMTATSRPGVAVSRRSTAGRAAGSTPRASKYRGPTLTIVTVAGFSPAAAVRPSIASCRPAPPPIGGFVEVAGALDCADGGQPLVDAAQDRQLIVAASGYFLPAG